MWTRYDLKSNAKSAFKRNYWKCVLVSLVVGMLSGNAVSGMGVRTSTNVQYDNPTAYENYRAYSYGSQQSFDLFDTIFSVASVGILIAVLIFIALFGILIRNILVVGRCRYYLENREHDTRASKIFYGFQGGRYGKIVWTMFVKELYIVLWTLLFIIPGIIKTYSYMLVPYILAENPQIDRSRAIALSQEMMRGYKMEAFILDLSFLGWVLLTGLTCGIAGVFYVSPYMDATYAEFYTAMKMEGLKKGITTEAELSGFQTETA